MTVEYVPLELPRDDTALVEFLSGKEWPFHRRDRLTADDVLAIDFASDDVASFWICERGQTIGLVRVFDLGDIGDGASLFDLRIAAPHRGRGVGTQAVRWLTTHLFTRYPELHRVEANTRHDNVAMQRALVRAGCQLEGRLREAWASNTGERFDAMLYGILRLDWHAAAEQDA